MASQVMLAAAFVVGVVVGIGLTMLYLQWRTRRQLQQMQDELGGLMDMDDDLGDAFDVELEEDAPGEDQDADA